MSAHEADSFWLARKEWEEPFDLFVILSRNSRGYGVKLGHSRFAEKTTPALAGVVYCATHYSNAAHNAGS